MARSEITVDLGAIRRNVRTLLRALEGSELWAVVKADGYGHGAVDVAGAALGAGATALCVATVPEALVLRQALGAVRILVMGPATSREIAEARDAALELVVADGEVPEGIRAHLKLDTGMGRWGLAELPAPGREVVGLMSHFASADCDAAFTEQQIERFRAATDEYSHLTRHLANSAGALRYPAARFDAARCGIALYGISPFGTDPAEDGLEPALRWDSELAQVRQLQPGESTGYGRRFVAEEPTWIGIVPVGYADGFRRDLTGTEVRVAGELRRVVGTISMDALAVELDRELPVGTPVTLLGHGVLAEAHARVAEHDRLRARDRHPQLPRAGAPLDRRLLGFTAVAGAGDEACDEAGEEGLAEREDPIPARHEELALARLDGVHDPLSDELPRDHSAAEEPAPQRRALRKALGLDEPGEDGVHLHAAWAEQPGERARERELSVLGGRVRPRRGERDRAGDRDDVDDMRARLQARLESPRAPDAAEVVRPDHGLDPLGLEGEEVAAAGDTRVVDEQVDAGMARRGSPRLRGRPDRARRRRRARTRRPAPPRAARAAPAGGP